MTNHGGLDVEAEVHYIAVAHNVFFSFDSHFSGFSHACFASESHVVVVFDYFGAYKSFFKIGEWKGQLSAFFASLS